MSATSDITAIFYTANLVSDYFSSNVRKQLLIALDGIALIEVPLPEGWERSHLNIYRQALIGAKQATTKYIALCEDDILYSPEHFKQRPYPGKFCYNLGYWGVYTWNPMFSWKGRRNLSQLICERELFISAMEERFKKYPDDKKIDLGIWAEPGKYERQLGVAVQETEEFYSNPPNIMFSHEDALAYNNLGKRKRLGELRAIEIPYWGHIDKVMEYYNEP